MIERVKAAVKEIGRGGVVEIARAAGIPHATVSRINSGKLVDLRESWSKGLKKALDARDKRLGRKLKREAKG